MDGAWGTKRAMGRISRTGGWARAVAGSAVAFLLGLCAACGSEPEEPQWGGGGALVEIADCAVYRCAVALRLEDGIRDLRIRRLGIGSGVEREIRRAGGGPGRGYLFEGRYAAPASGVVLEKGPAAWLKLQGVREKAD